MFKTENAVAGEVYAIMKNFKVPFEKKYNKSFNDKNFVEAVAKRMNRNLPEYVVSLTQLKAYFELRVDRK